MIRPVKPGDEVGAANVHIHSWREAYSGIIDSEHLDQLPARFNDRVSRWKHIIDESNLGDRKTLLALKDGNIVGFVSVGSGRDEQFKTMGEIWSLYLLRACHSQKIGYLLLCEGMKALKNLGHRNSYVWVLKSNPTEKFYLKSGATDSGVSKGIEIGSGRYEEKALVWSSLENFQ